MQKVRADLGFADALDEFDPNEWPLSPSPSGPRERDAAATAAKVAGFPSREAHEKKPLPPRRRRTGRNAQINLKAKPETIREFSSIADEKGWGLGEAFEHVVELLKRKYASDSDQGDS